MKEDEIKFFRTCYKYCPHLGNENATSFRNIINILDEFINYKRCWYLLKKWSELGFYNYGVSLDLGWFEEPLPEKYKNLLKKGDKK